jgi:hypothetical protein
MDWLEGLMKCAGEMGSGAIMYIHIFVDTGSGSQKLIKGDTQTVLMSHKATFVFSEKEFIGRSNCLLANDETDRIKVTFACVFVAAVTFFAQRLSAQCITPIPVLRVNRL